MKRLCVAVTTALILLLTAACGSSGAEAGNGASEPEQAATQATGQAGTDSNAEQQAATVDVTVLSGTQLFPIYVMQNEGIAKKHNIKLDMHKLASVSAVYTRFRTDSFNVGFGAWTSVARFIAKGGDLTNVYSMYGFTNDVLVKKESSIKSFADLKGKTIGVFGSAAGTTTLMFRAECEKFFGFDPLKDSKIKFLAPGLLAQQLKKGGVDAALLLDPIIVNLLETGDIRSVGNIGEIWEKHTGATPMLVSVTMNSAWAKENSETASRFVAAFKEALTYMATHDDVWAELAKSVNITSSKGIALLQKRVSSAFINEWTPELLDAQKNLFRELKKTLGKAANLPSKLPEGTFSRDYV